MQPWLGRANVPAQHSCSSPSYLWHKGLAELYNALCSHRHSPAQAVLQTLVEAHRREIFCPSLVYTALSVTNVSQTRQVHWSHPDATPYARKSPEYQPKHDHAGTELQGALLPPALLTTTCPVTKHSQRSLKHSSGVRVEGVGWNLLGYKSAPSTAEWQLVLHRHFMQSQCSA